MTPKDWSKVQEMMDAQEEKILAALASSGRAVKSIQKQVKAGMANSYTFTIAEVDPDKCFVYVNGSGGTGDDGYVVTYNGMTATTVSVYCHANKNTNVAIEVIEFN